MTYEFFCTACPAMPIGDDGKHVSAAQRKNYPAGKAPSLGKTIKCPCCGRKTSARVMSISVIGFVRGKAEVNWRPGERVRTCVNGKELSFEFVDHKHTDPTLQRNLAKLAQRQGLNTNAGIGRARYDPKFGRMVVDVASNVRDPLGKMAQAQKEAEKRGQYEKVKRDVNQPVNFRRGAKLGTHLPVGAAMSKAKAKRMK